MIINKTEHDVVIRFENGSERIYPPEPLPARVGSVAIDVAVIDGVQIVKTVFTEVVNLPVAIVNTFYIVSAFVIAAVPGRRDLVRPDTGPDCIRDEAGKIIAVRRLTR